MIAESIDRTIDNKLRREIKIFYEVKRPLITGESFLFSYTQRREFIN